MLRKEFMSNRLMYYFPTVAMEMESASREGCGVFCDLLQVLE